MIVQLAARARAEFDSAIAFLAEENARAADQLRGRIERAVESLGTFPNRGRPGWVDGARELPVRGTAYVIVYIATQERVRVVRIRHASQDPSP